MVSFEKNGIPLELPPGTTLEIEQPNPALQFGDEVIGAYSLPFEVTNSKTNLKELNYAGFLQTRVDNKGIDVTAFDEGLQHSIGKIKIEKVRGNINRPRAGGLNCYYLGGASSFYQDSKNKNLRSIDMGGVRSFAWDGTNLAGAGFWAHVNNVMHGAPNDFDYAFYPVINQGWTADNKFAGDLMNGVAWESGAFHVAADRIVPFPYLHTVLRKAVEFCGWQISGDILTDENFLKITMINFLGIDWAYYKRDSVWSLTARNPITFNIANHLPDITINSFIIALKNRFGWWYDFNNTTKQIVIRSLASMIAGPVKDMTTYASPLIPKNISQQKKIYSLKNTFVTDLAGGAVELDAVLFQGRVNTYADLPTAQESRYSYVYLVVSENNYYICYQNETTSAWEWQFFSYNIFDYLPADATDEITTEATTVGMEQYDSPISIIDVHPDFLPRIDNQGQWPGAGPEESTWGIHLCFYHGVRNTKDARGYPFGSSHIYDSNAVQVADWSLTFDCWTVGGVNVGLYEIFWKAFLNLINNPEEFTCILDLPRHEFMVLKFSDRIIIDGMMMFIKSIKSKLPYNKSIEIQAIRI